MFFCYNNNTLYVGPCNPVWQFSCGDNTCINRSLICNDQVNCNHSWDELDCKPSTLGTSLTYIRLLFVAMEI